MRNIDNRLLPLTLILTAKAFAIIFVILYGGIGLGPDEAQYWTWSQALDAGYYSKPPAIAWEIALGTFFLGNSALGVRIMPVILGTIFPLLLYRLSILCKISSKAAFWAAICLAFSPIGIFASFLAITDCGMILFWTASLAYVASCIENERRPNYAYLGLLILCGALFKWPMFLFWPLLALGAYFLPILRPEKHPVRDFSKGISISLLSLLPSLYWNIRHDFATFRHVLATLAGGHSEAKQGAVVFGNPLEFIGSQIVLVSPIFFALLAYAIYKVIKQGPKTSPGLFFCALTTLALFTMGLIASIFMKIQGNWVIFAYPSGFVLLGYYFTESKLKDAGLALSIALTAFVLALPWIQSTSTLSQIPIPYRINPFKHNVGWQNLDEALLKADYDPKIDFLFGDKYQTASILSFYSKEQKRAYFLNLNGIRNNQFSYWPSMAQKEMGKTGYFVAFENGATEAQIEAYTKNLLPYFKEVNYLGYFPLFFAYGKPVKGALIFKCRLYNGREPAHSSLY
jgi:4-amino-4-deoxy-L-arabinose transferase-like glycosyltransferase